ncbi:MAG: RsmB/NOP family class I SAM-dependent RNA methyltransferase [Alphaproteobacteria bacterium]|nr:RsmB/NOP family class I SAM-dependent RNA methyltransferase [Alphaproteobacteria bacterium]
MTDAPNPRILKNLPPRHAALSAVMAVHKSGTALDGGLASHPDWKRMEARDRGFARAIATAAIRRDGALRAALDTLIDRPLPDKALKARMVLLCGAAERLALDGAAHAAVDGWVSLMANDASTRNYKNLANAVLRRVASGEAREAFEACDPLDDLPAWLHRRWVDGYGEETARAMAVARSGPPPLDLTCKPGVDAAALAEALGAEVLPNGTVRRAEIGTVEGLPGFEAGDWWVQDAAAALPVQLLKPQAGETIADLCAAPGGKTMQIAASGAVTLAVEASGKRLKRVEANLHRTGLKAELINADAIRWRPEAPLDGVLLDAPCTATGTLRRRPDTAFAKQDGDVANLAAIQDQLLDAAADMVKSGGRIVYCTCSLEREEGEDRIAALLARRTDLRLDPVRTEDLPDLTEAITPDGAVRTRPDLWADRGGLDGFYMARLVKA